MISPSRDKHIYRTNIYTESCKSTTASNIQKHHIQRKQLDTAQLYAAILFSNKNPCFLRLWKDLRQHNNKKLFISGGKPAPCCSMTDSKLNTIQPSWTVNVAACRTINSCKLNTTQPYKILIDELPPFATNLTSVLSLSLSLGRTPSVYSV